MTAALANHRAILVGGRFGGVAKAAASAGVNAPKRFVDCVAYNGSILPVSGWDYPVVVDLSGLRVKDKSRPVLLDHDSARPVGHFKASAVRNTGRELLIADGVFSANTPEAARVQADAENGFPWQMSITARLERGADGQLLPGCLEFIEAGEKVSVNGRTLSGPIYVFRKSWLDEVSFVVRGADDDTSVALAARALRKGGKGMSATTEVETPEFIAFCLERIGKSPDELTPEELEPLRADFAAQNTPDREAAAARLADLRARLRCVDIEKVAAKAEFADIPNLSGLKSKALADGLSAAEFETKLLYARLAPIPNAVTPTAAGASANDGLVAEFLHRTGKGKPGTAPKRHTRVEDAFRRQLSARGADAPADVRGLMKAAWNASSEMSAGLSTVSLPAVFTKLGDRHLVDAFGESPATFKAFCKVISVPDFRVVKGVRMSEAKNLEPIPGTGEVKHHALSDESVYELSVDRFASVLRLNFKDVANDDLGVFADNAALLGKAAARTLADLAYRTLLTPGDFFSIEHNNLVDDPLNFDGLNRALLTMRTQRDFDGNDLDIVPQTLVVPPELEAVAKALLESETLQFVAEKVAKPVAGDGLIGGRPTGNGLRGSLTLVVEPRLSNFKKFGENASKTAWYLFSAPASAPMVVAFLDGKDRPTIETFGLEQSVDTMAYSWRVWHDFGVALGDWRAVVRSTGVPA